MAIRPKVQVHKIILWQTRQKQSTLKLRLWIRGITGHNNLSYFKAKQDSSIGPTCSVCSYKSETMHHLLTQCEALNMQQRDILGDNLILPDLSWSIKRIMDFILNLRIAELLEHETNYAEREIIFEENQYSPDSSSTL